MRRAAAVTALLPVLLAGCVAAPAPAVGEGGPGPTVPAPASVPSTPAPVATSAAPAASSAAPAAASAAADAAPVSANLEPVHYFQFDEAWAAQPYGPDPADTVRRWACGPADMAMVVATLRDSSVDVADASAWAQENDYFTNKQLAGKTKDSFFADYGNRYGIRVVQVNTGDLRKAPAEEATLAHAEALQAVKGGDWVIALMGVGPWTTEAHYVLWYDAPGDDVLIKDSNSKKPAKARNSHSLFIKTVQRYWIVDVDRREPA